MTPGVIGGIVFELASTDSCLAVDMLPQLKELHGTARNLPFDVLGPPRIYISDAIESAVVTPTPALPSANRLCRQLHATGSGGGHLQEEPSFNPFKRRVPSMAVGFFVDIGTGSLVLPVTVSSWKPGLVIGERSHWRARTTAYTSTTSYRCNGGLYHGLRAHLACIALLDDAWELDLHVKVWDWTDYWSNRSSGHLYEVLKAWNEYAVAAATAVRSIWGLGVSAPSLDPPDHGGDEDALARSYWADAQELIKRTNGQ